MGNVADYKEPEFLKSDHCTMVFFRLQYMEKLTKSEINIKGGDLCGVIYQKKKRKSIKD